jgi:hypothetical protein
MTCALRWQRPSRLGRDVIFGTETEPDLVVHEPIITELSIYFSCWVELFHGN